MAAAQGSDYRQGATVENSPDYAASNFKTLARGFRDGGIRQGCRLCADVEHFSGAVMISLAETASVSQKK